MKKYLAIFLFACLGVSGKLLANTITVSSIADLQNAINAAKPGDINQHSSMAHPPRFCQVLIPYCVKE